MLKKLIWNGDKVLLDVKVKSGKNLEEACQFLERKIKKSLTSKGSGIKWSGQSYPSSAPGEPPATQTGTLLRSITSETDKSKLIGRVGTNLEYGLALEIGTNNIKPRPYLRNNFENNKKEIAEIISG